MNEWKEYKLGEITTKIGSGATPTGGSNAYKLQGIPLIRSQNVHDFYFSYDGLAYIDEKQADNLKNVTVKTNDVLLNITGDSVARVCKVPNEILQARVNQHVAIVRVDEDKTTASYVLYYLQSIKESLLVYSEVGGTRKALTKAMIEDIDVSLPPLPEQTAIAEVLSSLDDKIDLLHHQNKTLEQLAETLFKAWFVEGAEESWEEASLKDIADHYKESVNPSKFPESVFYHFSLPAFDEGKYPKAEIGKDILSNKYKVVPNSILISKLNPRFPRIWELYGNDILENSICSTEFQIVKPKDISFFGFTFCFLKSNQITQELANAAGGTSGSHQRVNPDDIFNLSFQMPPYSLIKEFHIISKEHLQKIGSNTQQIQTLTQLRDTLLPKLMSGEVRVKYN